MGPTMRELCPWYALCVKHQHERAVRDALELKGFEALSPTYRTRRQWSDRTREIELPWFSGYVFCRFADADKAAVLDTPAVSRIVGFGGKPVPIPGQEIEAIRAVMAAKMPVQPWLRVKPGDRVRIVAGPLRGIEGYVLREASQWQLVIGVELLQRSVAVRVDPAVLAPAGNTSAAHA